MALKDHKIDKITVRETDMKVFRIHMNNGWDGITAIFDEVSGLVSIDSSFVTCGYSWPMPGRGKESLIDFFMSADKYYLSNKFSYGHEKEFRERFSASETIKNIKKHIIKARRQNEIDKATAREYLEEVEDIDSDINESSLFVQQLEEIGRYEDVSLMSVLGDEWWEKLRYEPSSSFISLRDTVIPLIKQAITETRINATL